MKFLKRSVDHLDDVVFEGRNKKYGAYALRHEADGILTKAMVIGVSLLGAMAITPLVISNFQPDQVTLDPVDDHRLLIELYEKEIQDKEPAVEKEKPVELVAPPKIVDVKTYNAVEYQPKRNADESRVPTKEQMKEAAAGIENKEGEKMEPNSNIVINQSSVGTANGIIGGIEGVEKGSSIVEQPKTEDLTVRTQVDINATFVGGIDAFRNKVMNAIDISGYEDEGQVVRTEVTFIVEKDGSISGLKANGIDASFNKEAIRAIKSVKGKWIPAKVNEQNVRSYFSFPIALKFQ